MFGTLASTTARSASTARSSTKQPAGVAHVLEHVGGDDRVVRPVLVDGERDALFEVGDDELIEPLLRLRRVLHVDADDVVATGP